MAEMLDLCEYSFTCPLPNGLHARPANTLERLASGFASDISIVNLSNQRVANAKSVLSLVGADIKSGDSCVLKVGGKDSQKAYREIVRFLETEFAECDEPLAETHSPIHAGWLPPMLKDAGVKVLFGTPVVPGCTRGKIVSIEGLRLPECLDQTASIQVEQELLNVDEAVAEVCRRIRQQLEKTARSSAERGVLQAHLSIAQDVELLACIRKLIQEKRICAGQAILEALGHFSSLLKAAQSELIRERITDLQDVCSQLIEALYGTTGQTPVSLTEPSIVVAENLTPSQFLALDKNKISGLVLLSAGTTSHTIILARSFGIPVLTGVEHGECLRDSGGEGVLDADYGVLIPEINERVERFYAFEHRKYRLKMQRDKAFGDKPAVTQDGRRVAIMANVATAEEVAAALRNGADGIGLFRTEMLFLSRSEPPSEDEQFDVYKKAAALAEGRPVIIRTFDLGGDKMAEYLNLKPEENPFLGYRGVRLYPDYEDLFRTQLSAILRASVFGKLKIMIPMVSCVEQVTYVRGLLDQVKAELSKRAAAFDPAIEMGIMMEVPLAAFVIGQLAELVDFLSIGTNDLAQYFMAVDRTNEQVAPLYQCHHPGFLALIDKIVDDAHQHNLHVGMCGEMAGQLNNVGLLLGAGLDSLSMSIPSVPEIKAACSLYDSGLCRELLKQAMMCRTAEEVDALQSEQIAQAAGRKVVDVDLVDIHADCTTKEEAIKYACDTLFLDRRTDNPVALERDFWKREAIYSTGLGHGFAIPHCKTKHILSNSICVFRLGHPVEWGAIDGNPVSVIIAMAIRDTDRAGDTHLRIFSRLSRNLMHEVFREKIRSAAAAAEIVSFLSEKLELNGRT